MERVGQPLGRLLGLGLGLDLGTPPRKCRVPREPMLRQRQETVGGELTPPLPQTIVDILECSNKKKLWQLTCELKEWEEKEESKMKREDPWGELPGPLSGFWGVSRAPTLHPPFGNQQPRPPPGSAGGIAKMQSLVAYFWSTWRFEAPRGFPFTGTRGHCGSL